MNPFAWSGLLAGVSSLCFGLLVFWKSPNSKLALIWFLFALSVASWGFGGMWFGTAKSMQEGLWGWRLAYAPGVIWIASIFHHFVCEFLQIRRIRTILVHYLISLA